MKKLLFTILSFSLLSCTKAQLQKVALDKYVRNKTPDISGAASCTMGAITEIKSSGVVDEARDAVVFVGLNNHLHIIAGAIGAVTATNEHYVYDTLGNRIAKFNAPFAARADIPYSLIGNKITIVGGDGGNHYDIWQFDPQIAGFTADSWVRLTEDFRPQIGYFILAFFFDNNGEFYIGGGQYRNQTAPTDLGLYKTSNFTTWTRVGDLPMFAGTTDFNAGYKNLMTAASTTQTNSRKSLVIGGGIYGTGYGTTSLYSSKFYGGVWEFNSVGNVWTRLTEDKDRFGQLWPNAVSNEKYTYYIKGAVHANQVNQFSPALTAGNQPGMLRTADGGITWESIPSPIPASHATGVARVGNSLYWATGNLWNKMFKAAAIY